MLAGGWGNEDGQGQVAGQDRKSTDVVGVFVGDEEGGEAGRVEAKGRHAVEQGTGRQSGINEDGSAHGFDEGGVASTATGKESEAHWGRGFKKSLELLNVERGGGR